MFNHQSENSNKMPVMCIICSYLSQPEFIKLHLFSTSFAKTKKKKISLPSDITTTSNPHIWEVANCKVWTLLLDKWLKLLIIFHYLQIVNLVISISANVYTTKVWILQKKVYSQNVIKWSQQRLCDLFSHFLSGLIWSCTEFTEAFKLFILEVSQHLLLMLPWSARTVSVPRVLTI